MPTYLYPAPLWSCYALQPALFQSGITADAVSQHSHWVTPVMKKATALKPPLLKVYTNSSTVPSAICQSFSMVPKFE